MVGFHSKPFCFSGSINADRFSNSARARQFYAVWCRTGRRVARSLGLCSSTPRMFHNETQEAQHVTNYMYTKNRPYNVVLYIIISSTLRSVQDTTF